MQKGMNKKAAIELSIGTVVIVVLAMTMLILGLILVRTIFAGSTRAVEDINAQVKHEINKLFGEDKRLIIYPSTNLIEVRQGKTEGFVLAIKNLLIGSQAASAKFSYKITPVSDFQSDCGISLEEVKELFSTNAYEGKDIPISTGEPECIEIYFDTVEGDPLCTIRFRVDVSFGNNQNYDTEEVYVKFKG